MSEEKNKDIIYKIVIPEDPNMTGDDILDGKANSNLRKGGYCGEKLLLWLVAVWGQEVSYLGKVEWEPSTFTCELTEVKQEAYSNHVSTTEIKQDSDKHKSVVRELSAAVPLTLDLLHNPCSSAKLTIWKDDFSTKVVSTEINISLPVSFMTNFKIEVDSIILTLDFSNSNVEIDSFDLHFTPQLQIGLAEFENAFAMRRIANTTSYRISMASSESIRLLKNLQLALSVIWNKNSMMSHFVIETPIPGSPIGLLWIVPKLEKLKQTPLQVEVTNISTSALDIQLELSDRPLIPLIKNISIPKLLPNERRTVDVPCVPCVSGTHELLYRIKIGKNWFKPLFQTIVSIE